MKLSKVDKKFKKEGYILNKEHSEKGKGYIYSKGNKHLAILYDEEVDEVGFVADIEDIVEKPKLLIIREKNLKLIQEKIEELKKEIKK